ncbi:MAG: 50S ribosomal protein L23 [Candidatus Omnitrophica bacterium CG11_big_fil_rev_8_21_14_0_20_42_13]|uniref:Large ribosomal subunit protein uL23 n=1 Tax=Candidatus Ghiorseimicrobium undicola TaxID=1974746 RepID=A0A2H0LVB4_9BACT|nr:MAG: 50S ribosomal protein L23 [Candidatus Omnitrophica bacterium CG11_big_fil_rev_8_21_14_0_20_42_13]
MDNYDVVKTIIRTEKSTNFDEPFGRYVFWVNKRANKIQIKKAVESIYKVKVDCVNTLISKGKAKRLRYQTGYTSDWKKAIVSLKEGHKIDTT